jgi:capsid protein
MLEAWRFVMSRRLLLGQQFCTWGYSLWLEEAIDKGDVETPPGAPDFQEAKTAYCKSLWYGPKRGQVDPLKESRADEIKYKMRTRTLEDLCVDEGADWESKLEQLAREKRKMQELGLTTEEVTEQIMEPETEQDIEDITTE